MTEIKVSNKPITENSIEWSCRAKDERLFPDTTWKEDFLMCAAITVQHPFLQKLVDYKGLLTVWMGEWTYFACKSMVMLHIYKDFVNIECISTPDDARGQGSATNTMKALVAAAKETGTELRLRACNVTGHGWNGLPNHPVVANGMRKKGKIPTASLPAWYEKFGFVKVANAMHRGKKQGVNMILTPPKLECYIEYLNKSKNFIQDKVEFFTYDEAVEWGKQNLENFHLDMVHFNR